MPSPEEKLIPRRPIISRIFVYSATHKGEEREGAVGWNWKKKICQPWKKKGFFLLLRWHGGLSSRGDPYQNREEEEEGGSKEERTQRGKKAS